MAIEEASSGQRGVEGRANPGSQTEVWERAESSPEPLKQPADATGSALATDHWPLATALADDLTERLAGEMVQRWRQGERPLAEDYFNLYAQLWNQPEAAIELIYEEICLRQEFGPEATAEDLVRRFPQWRAQLQVLVACHQLFEPRPAAPRFPNVGESWADFRLLAELGRGAHGRVFLATQPSLADRPIVLKLIPFDGREHLSLARMQHTHIVPLYAVYNDPVRNLRALCMPYFGGASLAQLLEALQERPPVQRTGQDILSALEQRRAAAPLALPGGGPASQFLARASYVQALCWIAACLAEALHYAHERGLVHLDLKPSNVLLAADGQPMLLDFHLAREPIRPEGPLPEWLGGTLPYMAPEQQAALAAVRSGRAVCDVVDGRADVYSLGVLLDEALSASLPPLPSSAIAVQKPGFLEQPGFLGVLPLCRRNPQVSVGLSDIISKSLAQDPSERYLNAASLAADLRRHLTDLPLRRVANRSLTERWRKWRRRRPYALAFGGLVLMIVAAGSLALTYVVQQHQKADAALKEGRELHQQGHETEAGGALKRGLALAEDIPFSRDLVQQLKNELRLVERADAAQELHLFVDRIRVLYGVDWFPPGDLRVLEAHCRSLWEKRKVIAERLEPGLSARLDQQVRIDLLDLAILWTDLRVRLTAKAEGNAARRDALRVLAQAEEIFGPSPVLFHERQTHAVALGLTQEAQTAERRASEVGAMTSWEHYALGLSLLRSGKPTLACKSFERALRLEPQSFWPNFYLGKCAYDLGHSEEAVVAFTACVVLAPDFAWCFYNRALAYAGLGQFDRALQDYDRALQLDPRLAAAALNRGMLHYRQQHYTEALKDLQQALDDGADSATVHYNMALVYLARGDPSAAGQSLRRALQHNPEHKEARKLRESLPAMR